MEASLYLFTQTGFFLLTLIYFGLFIREIHEGLKLTPWEGARKRKFLSSVLVFLLLWGIFVAAWSLTGPMSDFSMFPLNLMPVLLIPLVAAVIFCFFSGLPHVLKHIPPENFIRLQSFRFFVEILLWMLFIDQLLPVQMTFEGRNFDILVGISAPIMAYLAFRRKISKQGLIIWNIIGLALLLNIVIIAILSTPSPWRIFMNEPANYIVARFPISWLPGFLVPLAYTLHFVSLRQLTQRSSNAQNEKSQLTYEANS